MDEIALLCNLHADGPATLKVLRRAGLRSLSHVSTVDIRKLADTLGVSPSFARRFAREARLLGGRMGVEGLDTEETTPVAAVATGATTHEVEMPFREPAVAREPSVTRELELARESDARRRIAREVRTLPEVEFPEEEIAPARAIASPERPTIVPSSGTRLVSYVIAGLDRQACDRLVAQGIRTLEELAVAPGLSLARRLEMPLPRLLDLQYLAQQRLNAPARKDSDAHADAAEREYVLHPSARAASSRTATAPEHDAPVWRPDIGHLQPPLRVPMPSDSEVAGPFA
jgi:hypothetical protein